MKASTLLMTDDALISAAASTARCVARAREEYHMDPATFASDLTRQDAAILNIQRAWTSVLAMAHQLVRRERLGELQGAIECFERLEQAGWIDGALFQRLKILNAYCHELVQGGQQVRVASVATVVSIHLDDCLIFSSQLLNKDVVLSTA